MSLMLKLIIPLLDDILDIEDLSEDSGFVGAFSSDINRPYLDNHTFLMYDLTKQTKEAYDREWKFRKLSNLHGWKVIYVNQKPYKIYTFCNSTKDAQRCTKGQHLNNTKSLDKIISFWKGTDESVSNYVFQSRFGELEIDKSIVPEEDYRPEAFWWLKTKAEL